MTDSVLAVEIETLLEVEAEVSELLVTPSEETLVVTDPVEEFLETLNDEVLVVTGETVQEVLDAENVEVLLEVAQQGLPGPQGLPGQAGVSFLTFKADGALGGHRAVVMTGTGKVGYADNLTPSHANAVVGITLGAASDGNDVQVQNGGEILEPSWNWALQSPVFLSTNGLLTQTCPVTGFALILGAPTSPDTLLVGIKQPFIQEA